VIADAANRDGMHARPGLSALMSGSLRRRSAVLEAVAKLRAAGWVVVEQERRPGQPTVFSIPGVVDPTWTSKRSSEPDLEKVQPTGPQTGPVSRTSTAGERSSPLDREVQIPDFPPYLCNGFERKDLAADAAPTGPSGNGSSKVTDTDPVKGVAHRLAVLAFEQPVKPVTRGRFPAVMARLEEALRAGMAEADLARAIRAGPVTWTGNGLTAAVSISQPHRRAEAHSSADTALRMIQEGRRA
jgi:hypothetical protein